METRNTMLKSEWEAFERQLDQATLIELFEIYTEVSQSDDWDGAFTPMQSAKCEAAEVEMTRRLELLKEQGII